MAKKFTNDDFGENMKTKLPTENLETMREAASAKLKYYTLGAASAAVVPIPLADAAMLVPLQSAMILHISKIYNLDMSKSMVLSIIQTFVTKQFISNLGRWIVGSLAKLFPGIGTVVGGVINGTTAAVITYALGRSFVVIAEKIKDGTIDDNVLDNVKLLASFGFADLMKDFANKVKNVDFKNSQNIAESIWKL